MISFRRSGRFKGDREAAQPIFVCKHAIGMSIEVRINYVGDG